MLRRISIRFALTDDPAAAAAQRSSLVAKAKVSPAARRKAARKRTEDGQPVHSFRTLLQDLANLTRNSVRFGDAHPTTILARPTPDWNTKPSSVMQTVWVRPCHFSNELRADQIDRDPDLRVREALALVFRKFVELRFARNSLPPFAFSSPGHP